MKDMSMEARFDRLEAKIDKLADAMIRMVEFDTKIDGLINHNSTQDARLNKHSETIDTHSVQLATTSTTSATNEWAIRLIIAAVVGGVAFMLRS
jgi:hypothetical protein